MPSLIQDVLTSQVLIIAIAVIMLAFAATVVALAQPLRMLTIARNTFVESVRQPIYFVLILLSGVFQIFNVWGSAYSMGYTESGEVSGDNKLLLDIGMATVFVCGTLLAAFVATAVISREIDNKTVLTVVSKPVSRVAVVIGKFVGVSGAILIAGLTMLLFLMLGLRHGVLSTAADEVDGPVVLFTLIAAGLSIGIAVWCNFFYGWSFTQTSIMLMCPLMLAAYLAVLVVSKKWTFQHIHTDFMPQITIAGLSVLMALLVLTAIATAASARLGQVMTIVVCSGVFVFGLLSNYFVGQRAFDNHAIARIEKAEPERSNQEWLASTGDEYRLTFAFEPTVKIEPGMPCYFSPNPNGFPLLTPAFDPPDRTKHDFSKPLSALDSGLQPALVFASYSARNAVVRHVGPDAPLLRDKPSRDDYVFITPTRVNVGAVAAWGVIPNAQFFWLVDAVSQNQPVPFSYLRLAALYAVIQIGIFLSFAVVLFQTREVG
ncbi:MAG: ABC transporter permease subunit [Phycisphaerales bacterium]